MKRLFAYTAVALLVSGSAFAQVANDSVSQSGAQSSVIVNSPSKIDSTIRNVPNVVSPGLTSSAIETCMGSSSAGVAGQGFGISFGSTWNDANCNARLDAKLLAQLGATGAAFERLCDQAAIRNALARSGRPCAADRARATRVAAPVRALPASVRRKATGERMTLAEMPRGTRYYDHADGRWKTR